MRKINLLIGIFLVINSISVNGQWEVINGDLRAHNFGSVDFVNNNVGWMISQYNSLFKTEDFGKTWNEINFGGVTDEEQIQADFINETSGWILIGKGTMPHATKILFTQDGGTSWEMQLKISDEEWTYYNHIYAVDRNKVFVWGTKDDDETSKILYTINAGATWEEMPFFDKQRDINSINFIDNTGLVFGTKNDSGYVARSYDGGNNWEEQYSDIKEIKNLQIVNDSTIYFLGRTNNWDYLLYISLDTLRTWTKKVNQEIASFTFSSPDTIYAFESTDGFGNHILIKSTNAGMNWIPEGNRLFNFNFRNSNIYFNGQNKGLIICGFASLHSYSQNKSWHVTNYLNDFQEVFFVSGTKGFALSNTYNIELGDQCDILMTNDEGENWEVCYSEARECKSLQFINETSGYFLANNAIIKTTDGGVTWETISGWNWGEEFSYPHLSEFYMHFLDENHGFIAGTYVDQIEDPGIDYTSQPKIVETTDGGLTWNDTWEGSINQDESFAGINSLYFINSQGWAVGTKGLIVKYTESNWQELPSFTNLDLEKVFFIEENHGWILAQNSILDFEGNKKTTLFTTNDGGESWDPVELDHHINGLYFINNDVGWAVGNEIIYFDNGDTDRGIILYTEDGGMNWKIQEEKIYGFLNDIHYSNGEVYTVGDKGMILKLADVSTNIDNIYDPIGLDQNYPNPFSERTIINYHLSVFSDVELNIYDLLGQKVATLVSEKQRAGSYEVEWDASEFVSGVYLVKLSAGKRMVQKKLLKE